MDLLRSAYTTTMRFYSDSDEPTRIQWYAVPRDRAFLPYGTPFVSSNWDLYDGMKGEVPGYVGGFPGEVLGEPHTYRKGQYPLPDNPPLGCNHQGTADQWLGNIPFAERRWRLIGSGGGLIDGAAIFGTAIPFIGFGGVLADGAAALLGPRALIASGGVLADGAAEMIATSVLIGSGGVLADGEAALSRQQALTAEGGLLADGAAEMVASGVLVGSGGVLADGAAGLAPAVVLTGSGGVLADGDAALARSGSLVGSGGVQANGSATLARSYAVTGSGGVLADGSAVFVQGLTNCASCTVARRQYQVVVAGVTNGTCSDCANANGTRTMQHQTGCTWGTQTFTICGGSGQRWMLTRGVNKWNLTLGSVFTYERLDSLGAWDCQSTITFTRVSQTGCNGPLTITLNPL